VDLPIRTRLSTRLRSLIARGGSPSIGASLALLVAACVLPVSLMSALLIFDAYKAQRDQLIRDTVATARGIASALDRDLAGVQSGLQVLATSPLLVADDLAGFYRQAKEVLASQNGSTYVLIDAAGVQRINTLHPFDAPPTANLASPQLLQIFATDVAAVTDIFIGPLTGKLIVAIGTPVHRDGKVVYVLSVGMFPERVARLLERQRLPADWIGGVFDRTGRLIARTRDTERNVGSKASPSLVEAAAKAAEGTVETVTQEGTPVISAFSRSEVSGWTVTVGIPKSTFTDGLQKALWLLIASTAALLSAGLWMAWNLGNRIATAIQGLTGPAMELGAGKAVTVPPLHLKEADDVGQALMSASALLLAAQHGAHYDALTGLPNGALFHEILSRQLAICARDASELAVFYIDIDGFKAINDRHGHAAGDELLRAVATRIQGGIRSSDIAARFGGDEFVVLLIRSGAASARIVAEKMVAMLSAPYAWQEQEIRVSASIGIAIFPSSAGSIEALLARADAAMYQAKKSGKNTYALAESSGTE
jgi:diguanylate cyclase (GGDEF)-like protein